MMRKKKLKPNPKRNSANISDKKTTYTYTSSATSTSASYQKKKVKKKPGSGGKLFLCLVVLVLIVGLVWFTVAKINKVRHKEINTDEQTMEMPDSQTKTTVEEETPVDNSSIYYYYSSLAKDKKALYESILAGISNRQTKIVLPANISDKLSEITSMIMCDHPEIFWIDGSYQYTSYRDKTELEMTYLYEKGEIKKRKTEIDTAVNQFLARVSSSDSQYEIAKKAFCYIIDTVDYVAGCSDNQNIYSSLVNHKSVCSGYTRAYQYLLQQFGIQVIYVSGTADGSGGWDNHAWNIISCDGEYYHVDVTFGDGYTNNDDNDMYTYQYVYLCLDDSTILRNHKISKELPVPRCTSIKNSYYVLNRAFSDEYDEQVQEHMRNSIESGNHFWSYQFSNYEAYKECLDDIKNSAYSSMVCEYLNDSCMTTYLNDDEMYCISCWY